MSDVLNCRFKLMRLPPYTPDRIARPGVRFLLCSFPGVFHVRSCALNKTHTHISAWIRSHRAQMKNNTAFFYVSFTHCSTDIICNYGVFRKVFFSRLAHWIQQLTLIADLLVIVKYSQLRNMHCGREILFNTVPTYMQCTIPHPPHIKGGFYPIIWLW